MDIDEWAEGWVGGGMSWKLRSEGQRYGQHA